MFYPQIPHSFTSIPQSQSEKQPSSPPNSESQIEKPFPYTSKHEFQNEIPLSDTMRTNFKLKYHFHTERRSFLKKISYFRIGRKSERELTNYLLTPKM